MTKMTKAAVDSSEDGPTLALIRLRLSLLLELLFDLLLIAGPACKERFL